MKPQIHFIYGTIISIVLYFLFKINLYCILLFWIGSWFIPDLDHAIYFVIKAKSLNIKKFWNYAMESKKKNIERHKMQSKYVPMFLHSFEFVIILFILSIWNDGLFYLAFGIIFHEIFDIIDYKNRGKNLLVKLSFIYTIVYNYRGEKIGIKK